MKRYLRKMFFIFCITISCFCSCTGTEIKRTEDGRYIEVINNYVKYIEFDGHEYVYYGQGYIGSGYRGSICHSPKCICLKDYKK